jgi:hypothetical protein
MPGLMLGSIMRYVTHSKTKLTIVCHGAFETCAGFQVLSRSKA